MRVIHTIAGLRADHGGPSRSVPDLCDALADLGNQVHLITGVPSDRSIANNFPQGKTQTHTVTESAVWGRFTMGGRFARELRTLSTGVEPTIVHDHGLWLASNHAIANCATGMGILRVVSPRGMLSAWSLRRRRSVKKVLWHAYQRRDLQSANAFHATSQTEAEDIRRLGFQQPILVLGNGISLPAQLPLRQTAVGSKQILFLSRIHPVKGVIELVRAFHQAQLPAVWRLVIAGPDEGGHRERVERLIAELGLSQRVELVGAVDDQRKWQLYADADLFVLPSFTENFGLVVAEAMASALPVITTTGTPWEVLNTQHLGWWVAPEVDALAAALAAAANLEPCQLRQKGLDAQAYATHRFAWSKIAAQMEEFYTDLVSEKSAVTKFKQVCGQERTMSSGMKPC